MRKALLALALVVGLGGGGAWYALGRSDSAEAEAEAKGQPGARAEAQHADRDDHSSSGELVRMPPIVISVFRDDRVVGQLSAAVILDVYGRRGRAKVEEAMPRLHDAYLNELHRLVEREQRVGHEVNVFQVKDSLTEITKRMLGPGAVRDVLIQAVVRKGG